MSKDDLARVTMRSFSRCVIGVARTRVLAYLDTFPGSREAYKLANGLSRDDCLAAEQLSFQEELFRWTAYDELYNRDFRKFDLAKVALVPETDYVVMTQNLSTDNYKTVAIWQLGECTVRAAPREADALVRTVIGSNAESAAIQAIVSHVSGCVNKDSKIKFSKAVLRGVLAEALYKIAVKAEKAGSARGSN